MASSSAPLGYLGEPGRSEVQKAIDGAPALILRSGKAAWTLTSDLAAAKRGVDMGWHFVAVAIDARMLTMLVRTLRIGFDN